MEFSPGFASTVQRNLPVLSDGVTSSAPTAQVVDQSNTGSGARVTVTLSDGHGSLGSLAPQAQNAISSTSGNRRAVMVESPMQAPRLRLGWSREPLGTTPRE